MNTVPHHCFFRANFLSMWWENYQGWAECSLSLNAGHFLVSACGTLLMGDLTFLTKQIQPKQLCNNKMLNKSYRFSWRWDVYMLTIHIVPRCNLNRSVRMGYSILCLYHKMHFSCLFYTSIRICPSGRKTPKQYWEMGKKRANTQGKLIFRTK